MGVGLPLVAAFELLFGEPATPEPLVSEPGLGPIELAFESGLIEEEQVDELVPDE